MKKNRVFKSLFFLIAIGILGGMSMHSCKKDVEPIHFYTPDAVETITITVIDSYLKNKLADVSVLVTYPDQSSETVEIEDGVLIVDIDNRDDGDLILKFEKIGFISKEKTISIDRSNMLDGGDWVFASKVMLTEANKPFSVTKGVEFNTPIVGSDATVKFPANCLAEDAMIAITETPAAADIAAESSQVEILKGRIALKSLNFLPEGQTFVEPIEVSFPIPNTTEDLVFATLVNGEWETVTVAKNGDGTGTALVSHFSDYILTTINVWSYEGTVMSTPVQFVGDCDEPLVATLIKTFDSNETEAKDDLPIRIEMTFYSTKEVDGLKGFQRTISAQYAISTLRNVTKNYSIEIPSIPVIWSPAGQQACHHGGGSGN
ncbi:hypothetical protein L3049_05935 [Labilibaculum sp. DW002]|uniref:DUF4382 domain-containing protein n=1 Tax=Paralabilibaculum antarcticum TaxID=2912572 RepID=A0ABT5VQ34_9BACT|nr:hypothetical protein [Labilibaculum sp. DW002]MDE5417544.1 hypothetical protein [Labilibaculum sp. DW002]